MITSYSETWGYGDALPSLPYNISPGVYADVCKAISERRKIKITYTDATGIDLQELYGRKIRKIWNKVVPYWTLRTSA